MATHDFYQRVSALSRSQRAALTQQLRELNSHQQSAVFESAAQSPQRLVAYVVPHAGDTVTDVATLQNSLKAKLPHYMVPAAIVPLAALPRTANGKVDTQALPAPAFEVASSDHVVAPRTPTETILTEIWQTVLGLDAVGIHDNFFELGGDSILSIQIVSQAREVGLRLAPNQLFEQPTIAELAAVVNRAPEIAATQSPLSGPVPLTPIQHWFFEQAMEAPQHWHQAMLVELPDEVSVDAVENAIATLWNHHDALRLSFSQTATSWQQVNAEAGNPPPLTHIDLSHLNADAQIKAVAQHGSTLHREMHLATGGLMRAAYLTRDNHQPNWLLISLHHLVVDAVSWQILHSDLATLLGSPHQPGQLPAKTTAFQDWAKTLVDQAAVRQSEAAFWFEQVESPTIRLPRDTSDTPIPTEATVDTVTTALDTTDTKALLQSVPAIYNTQINDVLLTALAQTLLQWADAVSGNVRVEVEAHGREAIADDVDVSRTVGWFTTTYPVRLQLSDRTDCAAALKSVKEQLRQIPNRGIGHGMLRYLGDEPTRQRLAQTPPSEILFNYLGQRDLTHTDSRIRIISDIDIGPLRDPRNRRSYLLEMNAWVANGQLQLTWRYDTQIYRSDTLQTFANGYLSALKTIIAHCTSTVSSSFTPSDFPDADLSQAELDDFIGQLTQEAP